MTESYTFPEHGPLTPGSRHITIVSAGAGEPSSTGMLADRLSNAVETALSTAGIKPVVHRINLRDLAGDIADSQVTMARSEELASDIRHVERADGLIPVSPTYKASYSGLFKAFFDLIEEDALHRVPVLLGATGGTPRHSLMIDQAMRPLFAYFKSHITPTAVYAATQDWGHVETSEQETAVVLNDRISRAGEELARILATIPARPRPDSEDSDQVTALEVTPFEQLLAGN